jgi:hypothetical protein
VDEFAGALRAALAMPEEEQERRMRRLRQQVGDNNIYRWAGMLLSEAGKLVEARQADSRLAFYREPLSRPWSERASGQLIGGRGPTADKSLTVTAYG